MSEVATNGPTTLLDVLKVGVSGWVDSQAQKNYAINDPRYNTERGVAGQAQSVNTFQKVATNPLTWVAVAGVVLAIVLIARR